MYHGNQLTALLGSLRGSLPVDQLCESWEERTTLLIAREEYANLFHTMRELMNAYQSLELAGLINSTSKAADVRERTRVIWLDGHAKGCLDDTWPTLFGETMHVSQVPASQCFRKVIMVHPGPRGILHEAKPSTCKLGEGKAFARRFAAYVLDAYGLQDVSMAPNLVSLIGRRAFRSHPRMAAEISVARRITNEAELLDTLRENRPELQTQLLLTTPDHMTFAEQIREVRRSRVIVAFHGAALMHMLFLHDDAKVVELTTRRLQGRDHYASLAYNADVQYTMEIVDSGWGSTLGRGDTTEVLVPVTTFVDIIRKVLPPDTISQDAS
eukprot:m.24650 g.24650  ORF g.24650 m.24650 type:complete len:326 (-) comp4040_c0_seq1:188-1165(-)